MKIALEKLHQEAILPSYATPNSAGADLYALLTEEESVSLLPGETKLIRTGIALAIPEGYVGLICARSGLSVKEGLAPANKVGVIDADYRGEVMVALYNQSKAPRTVTKGQRIAQLLIMPVTQGVFTEVPSLSATGRGEGGFGSTGK